MNLNMNLNTDIRKGYCFISKAIGVHGDRYDYSLVKYENSKSKVDIICKNHGIFTQRCSNHLSNVGCPKCASVYKKSTKEIILKFVEIYGNRYDYSLVKYENSKSKVDIICKIHGVFSKRASCHLSGSGCSKCSRIKRSNDDAILCLKNIHNDRYDYSKLIYRGAKEKVIIICHIHGEFLQKYSTHLSSSGCPKCSCIRKTTKGVISLCKTIHNNLYDYSKFIYTTGKSKSIIICKIHGEFSQIVDNHIGLKHGCPKCSGIEKRKLEDVVYELNDVHNNSYDYSKFVYKNSKTKAIIICKIHGEFTQRPDNHRNGQGCPRCSSSKGELKVIEYLNNNNNNRYITQKSFKDCVYKGELKFDFYLPDENICIEYDGIQHYEVVEKFGGASALSLVKKRDLIKTNYCKDNNIVLIRIPYWDFDNIYEILNASI